MQYQRYLTSYSKPFNPIELIDETQAIVCRDDKRKYTAFYCTGVYGGIATGYTVGCCLRCYYCWVDWSRDFPESVEEFFTPDEVFENLSKVAKSRGVRKARISGAEPTLCKPHLLKLLELMESSFFKIFILETNGILIGIDRDYAKAVAKFSKVHVRVSIKAGNGEGFERRTGAMGEFFELPFHALEHLKEAGASFHAAGMTDPRIMSRAERNAIIERLREIDTGLAENFEEEVIDPYDTTLRRLEYAGVKLSWRLKDEIS